MPRSAPRGPSPVRDSTFQTQKEIGKPRVVSESQSRSPSKPRPISMGPLSPPRSPPTLTVESPRSPPRTAQYRPITPLTLPDEQDKRESPTASRSGSPFPRGPPQPPPSRSRSPAKGRVQLPAPAPLLKATTTSPTNADPDKPMSAPHEPPPINRAGKPKMFSKAPATRQVSDTLQPTMPHESADERVSPFSTPPSSDPSSPELEQTPPLIRNDLKPKYEPKDPPRKEYFVPAPGLAQPPHISKRRAEPLPPPNLSSVLRPPARRVGSMGIPSEADLPAHRPGLPPRHDTADEVAPELPVRRSMESGMRPGQRLPSTSQFAPPPKRIPSLPLTTTGLEEDRSRVPAPPPRQSSDLKRGIQEARSRTWTDDSAYDGPTGTNKTLCNMWRLCLHLWLYHACMERDHWRTFDELVARRNDQDDRSSFQTFCRCGR